MAYKYEDYHDRFIRQSLPAVRVVFDEKGDSSEEQLQIEVTDVRGEIIEVKIEEDVYLHIPIAQLVRAVENHKTDYKIKG